MNKQQVRRGMGITPATGRSMPVIFSMICCLCLVWPAPVSLAANPRNADAIYRQAVEDISTAPLYVLITVVNDNTKQTRRFCTGGNFLLGAIHIQYHIPYNGAGEERALNIALKSKGHVFHFSDAKALRNIAPSYTQAEIDALEKQTAHYSTQQLYDLAAGAGWGSRQQAVAQILLEHGLACGMADMSGQLYVIKTASGKPEPIQLPSSAPLHPSVN